MRDEEEGEGEGERGRIQQESKGERCDEEKGGTQRGGRGGRWVEGTAEREKHRPHWQQQWHPPSHPTDTTELLDKLYPSQPN